MDRNRFQNGAPGHSWVQLGGQNMVQSGGHEIPPGFVICQLPASLAPPPTNQMSLGDIYRAAYEQAYRESEEKLWRKLGFESDWSI